MRAYNPLDTSNVFLLDEIHEYPNLNINLADTNSVSKKLKKTSTRLKHQALMALATNSMHRIKNRSYPEHGNKPT